jgi:hypothetical protein
MPGRAVSDRLHLLMHLSFAEFEVFAIVSKLKVDPINETRGRESSCVVEAPSGRGERDGLDCELFDIVDNSG